MRGLPPRTHSQEGSSFRNFHHHEISLVALDPLGRARPSKPLGHALGKTVPMKMSIVVPMDEPDHVSVSSVSAPIDIPGRLDLDALFSSPAASPLCSPPHSPVLTAGVRKGASGAAHSPGQAKRVHPRGAHAASLCFPSTRTGSCLRPNWRQSRLPASPPDAVKTPHIDDSLERTAWHRKYAARCS